MPAATKKTEIRPTEIRLLSDLVWRSIMGAVRFTFEMLRYESEMASFELSNTPHAIVVSLFQMEGKVNNIDDDYALESTPSPILVGWAPLCCGGSVLPRVLPDAIGFGLLAATQFSTETPR